MLSRAKLLAVGVVVVAHSSSPLIEHRCPLVEDLHLSRTRIVSLSSPELSWFGWVNDDDGNDEHARTFVDATYIPGSSPYANGHSSVGPVSCRYKSEYGSFLLYEKTSPETKVILRNNDARWIKRSANKGAAFICNGPSVDACKFFTTDAGSSLSVQ
ncbi:DUF3757 domain-containing protein [Herbaspirillum sp. CF444]|uniref:DUF3757 domain-containing protein n=1 Tax=Herbaspirillum sp. CF444 TaxID=1144319 RepID=UPI0009DA1D93